MRPRHPRYAEHTRSQRAARRRQRVADLRRRFEQEMDDMLATADELQDFDPPKDYQLPFHARISK